MYINIQNDPCTNYNIEVGKELGMIRIYSFRSYYTYEYLSKENWGDNPRELKILNLE